MTVLIIASVFIVALLTGILVVLNGIDKSLCEIVTHKRILDAVKRKRGNAKIIRGEYE